MRDRSRRFLVEGAIGIREAVQARATLDVVFVEVSSRARAEDFPKLSKSVPILEVSRRVMEVISGAATPPGEVAVANFVDTEPRKLLHRKPGISVVLAEVRDPGNVGTILRTAWAIGAEAAFLSSGTADIYNPKVVRASAGALFNLPMARDVDVTWLLEGLGRLGVRRIAADPRGTKPYDELDLTKPCALILGNEAWGVPDALHDLVDEVGFIPMSGSADSLNVGVAAAVFLFEAARQRRVK